MKGCKIIEGRESSYEETVLRSEFLSAMELNGTTILEPLDNQVFLDLDSDEDYEEFKVRLNKFKEMTGLDNITFDERPSASGLPHRHVILDFPFDLGDYERLAYQFAFNSDPTREFLTLCRIVNAEDRPNILFRKEE